METLYRQLLKNKNSDLPKELVNGIDNSEVILIDNVAEYFWKSEKDKWDFEKDFPNLAPPFENIWMEYLMPSGVLFFDGENKKHYSNGTRVGVLFSSFDITKSGAKWGLLMSLFLGNSERVNNHYFMYGLAIDKDGRIVKHGEEVQYMAMIPEEINATERVQKTYDELFVNVYPALLSISFLHCKNVEIIPRKSDDKKNEKRNRNSSKIKYKVLEIEPMKKVLREEGKSESLGLKQSLHICRGHFKDFSKGKGLFGKFKEMYWWDSQVRGNIENGIVVKEYEVNAPNEGDKNGESKE